MRRQRLLLDEGGLILEEYRRSLRSRGQPKLCDIFLKWVLSNRANDRRCIRVRIHRRPNGMTNFEEFPRDPALRTFDPDDRKFVATALAHGDRPPILQALDSAWWAAAAALEANGVSVEFLCPDDITRFRRAGVS